MLIKDGENGFLFKAGDSKELSSKLKILVESKEKRKLFGERLYEYAKESYSLKKLASTHINIYKGIMNQSQVVISGYYGFGNSGDEAILKSIVRDFKDYDPNVKITALSNNPDKTGKEYGINSINRINLIKISKEIKGCDLFISGGGSLLQDQTSTRSLMYYLFIIKIALFYKKRTMLYANGVGPINSKNNAEKVKSTINRIDLITLREEYSLKLLEEIGITKPKIKITADPVLTTSPIERDDVTEIFAKEGIAPEGKYIGVNIRRWKGSQDLGIQLAQSLKYIYEEYGLMPLFIPMSGDDMEIINNMKQSMEIPYKALTKVYQPEELIGIAGELAIVLAMRLHTLVYSSIARIPMIGLVYDPKIKGYLEYIGQPAAGNVLEIKSSMINDKVDLIMKSYEEEKYKLERRMIYLTELTKENVKQAYELMK